MASLSSLWQMWTITLCLHLANIVSSCMLTHIMVTTIPFSGLNHTFPITATLLLFPALTCWLITRSSGDFICLPLSGLVSGLGKLCCWKFNELRTYVIFLIHHVTKYQESMPAEQHPPNLLPSVKWLQQVIDQLSLVQMSFCHIEFVIWDLQRVWLNIWTVLDYMEIYKPCMDGISPPSRNVADTIGTFTMSIRVAQDMFLTSLPCWLIWPSNTFSKEKIFVIGEVFHPKEYIVLEPHTFNYPVIFQGTATSHDKYWNIELFAHNFLCSQDPFALPSLSIPLLSTPLLSMPPLLPGPPQASMSSAPAVAGSTTTGWDSSTGQNLWGAIHRPVRGHGAGKFSIFHICYTVTLNCYYRLSLSNT